MTEPLPRGPMSEHYGDIEQAHRRLDALGIRREDEYGIYTLAGRIEELAEARKEAAEARTALARLVALKDGPRDERYELCKPLAWDEARRIVRGGHAE